MYKWANKYVLTLLALLPVLTALAQMPATVVSISAPPVVPVLEASPDWGSLNTLQKNALQPIQDDWVYLDSLRKQKWLKVAKHYHSMTLAQQKRMHSRMLQWNKLTPTQRVQARDNYSAVLSSPSSVNSKGDDKLHEQWERYQALSPEKKQRLREKSTAAHTSKTTKSATNSP
jgi:hypothetical protein